MQCEPVNTDIMCKTNGNSIKVFSGWTALLFFYMSGKVSYFRIYRVTIKYFSIGWQ